MQFPDTNKKVKLLILEMENYNNTFCKTEQVV